MGEYINELVNQRVLFRAHPWKRVITGCIVRKGGLLILRHFISPLSPRILAVMKLEGLQFPQQVGVRVCFSPRFSASVLINTASDCHINFFSRHQEEVAPLLAFSQIFLSSRCFKTNCVAASLIGPEVDFTCEVRLCWSWWWQSTTTVRHCSHQLSKHSLEKEFLSASAC